MKKTEGQKITIDVDALFEQAPQQANYVGMIGTGALGWFSTKPCITSSGTHYTNRGEYKKDWGYLEVQPQLFERPVPSAWADVRTCHLPDDTHILWRFVHSDGSRGRTQIAPIKYAKTELEDTTALTVEWCPIPS